MHRKMKPLTLLSLAFVLFSMLMVTPAEASHFRFGHITWKRISGRTVEFTVTTAWRVAPFTRLNFGDGTFVDRFQSQMTPIASGPNYTVWRYTVRHTYANDGPFTVFFESCCRIGALVNAANAPFRVSTVVDLRSGNIGSPVSSIPAIVQMAQGQVNNIPLPIADPDGDAFTCRLATSPESRIPSQPAGGGFPLTVSPSCVLTWNTQGTSIGQLYAAQVMIEENHNGNTSPVALDFIIEIVGGTANQPPLCTLNGSTSNVVNVGQTFTISATGTDPDGDPLTVSHLGLPPGATLSPPSGSSGPQPLAATFSWTPQPSDAGSAVAVTLLFTDPGGLQSICAFSIQVPTNQSPDCSTAAIADLYADANGNASISAADVVGVTDPDGDPLTITVSPSMLVAGANAVTVTADDGNGGSCSTVITVNVLTDVQSPVCTLVGFDPGPPLSAQFSLEDSESGIATIRVERLSNATVEIPEGSGNFYTQGEVVTFSPPETAPVGIRATKIDNNSGATIVLDVTDHGGNSVICDPVYTTLSDITPEGFALKQNFPNPFNPSTTIHFSVASSNSGLSPVSVRIFDVSGREIKTLVNEDMAPGTYSIEWDGTNNVGQKVAGGMYLYRMIAGSYTATRKMVLMK